MCLALPGKIVSIDRNGDLPWAEVEFSGVRKKICLAYTPDAKHGEYVIVHVGFAISILDEKQALSTLALLDEVQL